MEEAKMILYGLSTCVYCSRAKGFLDNHSVAYESIMLDMLTPEERFNILEKVRVHNPNCSFPTLVIRNGDKVLIGFDENSYKELISRAA